MHLSPIRSLSQLIRFAAVLIGAVAVLCGLFAPHTVAAGAPAPSLGLKLQQTGVAALRYGALNLLQDGAFVVQRITFEPADGPPVHSSPGRQPWPRYDRDEQRVTWKLDEAEISCCYQLAANRLQFAVTVVNRSRHPITGVQLRLLELRFPQRPAGWADPQSQMNTSLGNPPVVIADFGTAALACCNEEIDRPLLCGFAGTHTPTTRPLFVGIGETDWASPLIRPRMRRPIAPGESLECRVSLRFGPGGSSAADLAGDILEKFRAAFPQRLDWPDRRPIGALFLSSVEAGSPSNPRGWFNDRRADFNSESGRREFQRRLLRHADASVRILSQMKAQGMIVWDVEGQEHPHAVSYLGDPRHLAPEMEPVIDEFFSRFTSVGLRTGLCIRPQRLVQHPERGTWHQAESPDPAATLLEKIAHARRRWGCTLFYVDSNGDPNAPLDASHFERVLEDHPDILLVPEHQDTRYYASTAPYHQLNLDRLAGTPPRALSVYPHALSVIYVVESAIQKRRADLLDAVSRGDILMFHGGWDAPENQIVRGIYSDARRNILR
jgi:hypothetical protein